MILLKHPTIESGLRFVCPITQELPIDPVTAEDGKVYERSAITEWLSKQRRSPSTGAAMGPRLLASTQARNTIEALVGPAAWISHYSAGLLDARRGNIVFHR